MLWDNKCITDWKACIYEIELPWLDMEIYDVCIIKHCGVCCRALSPTENVVECHIKTADGKTIHREIGEALVFPVRSDHVVDP